MTYATVKRSQGGGAWFPEGERREKKRKRQKGEREIPKMVQKNTERPKIVTPKTYKTLSAHLPGFRIKSINR